MGYWKTLKRTFVGAMLIILLTTALFTLANTATDRANFSGEWKLNMAKSGLGQFGVGNKVCLDWLADQMRPNAMRVARNTDFLKIDLTCLSPDRTLVTRHEILIFSGEESEVILFGTTKKKSRVRWSADGQTMIVNSVIYLDIGAKAEEVAVTEVWKLINDGKSISLQSKSNSIFDENEMNLVYDKAR